MVTSLVFIISGIVSTFIAQLVKRGLKLSDNSAITAAYAVSFVIALVVGYVSGDIKTLGDIVSNSTIIFGTSAIAYEFIIKSLKVGDAIDSKLFSK